MERVFKWTINLKSFEMNIILPAFVRHLLWTINLKSFEIHYANTDKATIH